MSNETIGKYQYLVLSGDILNDIRIKGNIKIFYAVLVALSAKEGYCFAENKKLAEIMSKLVGKIDTRQINNYLAKLREFEYIKIILKNNSQRKIYPIALELQRLKEDDIKKYQEVFSYDWLNNKGE